MFQRYQTVTVRPGGPVVHHLRLGTRAVVVDVLEGGLLRLAGLSADDGEVLVQLVDVEQVQA